MVPELKTPHYAQVVMVVDGAHQKLLNGELVELGLSSLDPAEYDPKDDERIRFQAKHRIGDDFFIGGLADGRTAVLQSSSGFHLYQLHVEERSPAEQMTVTGQSASDDNPLNHEEIGPERNVPEGVGSGLRPHQEHDYGM